MRHYPTLFITLLTGVTLLFLGLLSSLFFPLFWSVVFAIVCMPLYESIRTRIGSPTLSSLLTLFLVLLFVFAPITLMGTALAQEAHTAYQALEGNGTVRGIALSNAFESSLSYIETYHIETASLRESVLSWGTTVSQKIGTYALSFGRATAETLVGTCIMLYVLFFLLRDGARMGTLLKKAFPLEDAHEQFLFNRFAEMTRAMFKGTLVVALVQGLLGGLLFLIAGVSSPLLWALLMTLLAVIPGVGPALVWLPAGILLLMSGSTVSGIIVLLGGATVLSYVDNVLRPILIGRDTNMPDVLIFVSVIAGLSVFGVTGLVIGPSLAALTIAFWELYAEERLIQKNT